MSYPDHVFVAKFDADGSEKISFRFWVESAQKGKCRVKGADTLLLSGSPRGCVGGKDSPMQTTCAMLRPSKSLSMVER